MLATLVAFLLKYLVFALMLSVGCGTRAGDFADVRRRPRLYARALAVMLIGVPLLAMVVVAVFDLSPRTTGLILLMAVCPGAPFIATATKAKGASHSPVGLNLLVLVSAVVPLTVPIWVAILDRVYPFEISIAPAQVLRAVIPSVVVPLLIGVAIRRLLPRAADVIGRVAHYFFLAAMAVAIVVVLALGAPVFREVSPLTYLAELVVVTGSALLGYWAAGPAREERRVLGVTAALGNPGLALAIVAASYPGFKAAAFMAAYVLLRKLALIPFEQWIKHRTTPRAMPPSLGHTGSLSAASGVGLREIARPADLRR